ncbi:type II toxin-antitoxin system PemK/MazF family toxin [Formivibrio citricus]|uniref:type II toxin-antitoxin system PemK/MazF family toxin n=1 Tax=Formivibrio citricus TaxID=83765 RepID=UPI000B8513D3
MPLNHFYPKPGHILLCDFTRGFIEPEMVKRRPVVVISPASTHSRKLCTVVPLSTTAPDPAQDWHYLLRNNPCPDTLAYAQIWAKGDMLYTVSFERLDKLHRRTRNGREYYAPLMDKGDYSGVLAAVKAYLPL